LAEFRYFTSIQIPSLLHFTSHSFPHSPPTTPLLPDASYQLVRGTTHVKHILRM